MYVKYKLLDRNGIPLGVYGGKQRAVMKLNEADGNWLWEQSLLIENHEAKYIHIFTFISCFLPIENDIQNYYGNPIICDIAN